MVCVDVDAEPVKLVCWDTTGQVRTIHFALLFVLFCLVIIEEFEITNNNNDALSVVFTVSKYSLYLSI
jgi:hypothetical protein